MKQRTACASAVMVSALALCVIHLHAASPTSLYVATNGHDGWSGQLSAPNVANSDGPFASLERARNEIRRLKKSGTLNGGATVFVRSGIYSLPQGFQLEEQDSGTPEGPVVYRAFEGEKAVLIGGRPIEGFVPYQARFSRPILLHRVLRRYSFGNLSSTASDSTWRVIQTLIRRILKKATHAREVARKSHLSELSELSETTARADFLEETGPKMGGNIPAGNTGRLAPGFWALGPSGADRVGRRSPGRRFDAKLAAKTQ